MAPKKKGGKKQADDWENELGETIDPIAQATEDAKKAEADEDAAEEVNGGGGLMAALRKSKDKRVKKGKQNVNDFVDGEDAPGTAEAEAVVDLAAKAPAEGTFDDNNDDDVFAGNASKKGKGGKKQPDKEEPPAADAEDEDEDGGGVKSKKEKERDKKEREKQRKKEQVIATLMLRSTAY